MEVKEQTKQFAEMIAVIKAEIAKVYVGQDRVVEDLIKTIFAGGHSLIEGVPGLGKTLLVRTLSDVFDLSFRRIQFTPDLMPTDIIGTNIIVEDERGHKKFEFQAGPIFSQILLADEINRATPKTQSALLEAMQEGAVTAYGTRHKLQEPFFVLATQNPIEMEGTYPLPEAQIDRFLTKLSIGFPKDDELVRILDQTTGGIQPVVRKVLDASKIMQMRRLALEVPIADPIKQLVASLVYATHPDCPHAPESVRKYVRYGASPRGGQALILTSKVRALTQGRYAVAREDIEDNLQICLRHRLILSFEGQAEGVSADELLADAFKAALKARGKAA
ncbi:MAG: MoxR family ATPase [Candidatus Alcyoniella australis]|nr:MoxR family ATPase [Candidatus Alcyoniella australis]